MQMVQESRRAWHAGSRVLGRRNRYQFLLDRHRDRQSRPRLRLSGFSQASDRGGDRALPQHPDPQHAFCRCGSWRIPTWRRRASRIPAKNSRGARSIDFRRRPLGQTGADHRRRRAVRARRPRRRRRRACRKRSASTAMASVSTAHYDSMTQDVGSSLSASFPAGDGRRHRRSIDAGDAAGLAGDAWPGKGHSARARP